MPDKFYPYKGDAKSYFLLKSGEQGRARGEFPIPPENLYFQTFGATTEVNSGKALDDPAQYLRHGKLHIEKMKEILARSDFSIQEGNRILDFGCGAGRMIRWLDEFSDICEVWGVDISAVQMLWCQRNLCPPFKFFTITTAPHLPFEDRYFDLIYCGSIFTHIDDLADAWLLELRRILRPGGRLYITVADKHYWDQVQKIDDWPPAKWFQEVEKKEKISKLDFAMFTLGRSHRSHVFYDIEYLQRRWGCFLNVLSVTQDAYDIQTALVLER